MVNLKLNVNLDLGLQNKNQILNMNLLIDEWIPTRDNSSKSVNRNINATANIKQISLLELLSSDKDYELLTHRDDMELATIELLICLVQTVFTLQNNQSLIEKINKPLKEKEYLAQIKLYQQWFDIKDVEYPFLQSLDITTKDIVPIQKLFNGLPEGNNHTWRYHSDSRINQVCGSCASIMLFNQASNAPSFGGGFKNPLRGSTAPMTSLVEGNSLRETIWLNVLTSEFLEANHPNYKDKTLDNIANNTPNNIPNWVLKVKKGEKVLTANLGITRGLFWQPALVLLCWQPTNSAKACDSCGVLTDNLVVGFKREKFTYELVGDFIHPHSPYKIKDAKGKGDASDSDSNDDLESDNISDLDTTDKETEKGNIKSTFIKYLTITDFPWWTQVTNLVLGKDKDKDKDNNKNDNKGKDKNKDKNKDIIIPAQVIEQYKEIFPEREIKVVLGGYNNNQAKITRRAYKRFSLPGSWLKKRKYLDLHLSITLEISIILRKKAYGVLKSAEVPLSKDGLNNVVGLLEQEYCETMEPIILDFINDIANVPFTDKDELKFNTQLKEDIIEVSSKLFTEFIQRYTSNKPHNLDNQIRESIRLIIEELIEDSTKEN